MQSAPFTATLLDTGKHHFMQRRTAPLLLNVWIGAVLEKQADESETERHATDPAIQIFHERVCRDVKRRSTARISISFSAW